MKSFCQHTISPSSSYPIAIHGYDSLIDTIFAINSTSRFSTISRPHLHFPSLPFQESTQSKTTIPPILDKLHSALQPQCHLLHSTISIIFPLYCSPVSISQCNDGSLSRFIQNSTLSNSVSQVIPTFSFHLPHRPYSTLQTLFPNFLSLLIQITSSVHQLPYLEFHTIRYSVPTSSSFYFLIYFHCPYSNFHPNVPSLFVQIPLLLPQLYFHITFVHLETLPISTIFIFCITISLFTSPYHFFSKSHHCNSVSIPLSLLHLLFHNLHHSTFLSSFISVRFTVFPLPTINSDLQLIN